MSGFSNKPKILRGAFIEYGLSIPPLFVVFQFNPVQLSRSRSVSFGVPDKPYEYTPAPGKAKEQVKWKSLRELHQWEFDGDDLMANPEIASPREFVGKEPIVTFRFPLGTGGAADRPPWSELLRRVGDLVGVEHAAAEEEPAELAVVGETDGGDPVYAERYERALTVRFNRLSVTLGEVTEEVSAAATAAGLESGQPTAIGRVGKRITIPPRPAGRRS